MIENNAFIIWMLLSQPPCINMVHDAVYHLAQKIYKVMIHEVKGKSQN